MYLLPNLVIQYCFEFKNIKKIILNPLYPNIMKLIMDCIYDDLLHLLKDEILLHIIVLQVQVWYKQLMDLLIQLQHKYEIPSFSLHKAMGSLNIFIILSLINFFHNLHHIYIILKFHLSHLNIKESLLFPNEYLFLRYIIILQFIDRVYVLELLKY